MVDSKKNQAKGKDDPYPPVNMRLNRDLVEQLKELAELDDRTLQDVIRLGLEKAIPILRARFEGALEAEESLSKKLLPAEAMN